MLKKKVLYLASRPPYPVAKGDQVVSSNQLSHLFDRHDVTVATFFANEEERLQTEKRLGKCCDLSLFSRPSLVVSLVSMAVGLFLGRPLQTRVLYTRTALRRLLELHKANNYEVIHVQTIRMAEYAFAIRQHTNARVVIDFIDAMSLNMSRKGDKSNLFIRAICRIESRLCWLYEQRCVKSFDQVSLVSRADVDYFAERGIARELFLVNPNGVALPSVPCSSPNLQKKHLKVIFHGNMQYFPNVEAAEWLVNEIVPRLEAVCEVNISVCIVGKDPTPRVLALASDFVDVTGFVEDIGEYFRASDIAIYPMRTGTGLQNKVLEAMSYNMPTIVSGQILSGIPHLKHKESVIVADATADYAEGLRYLIGLNQGELSDMQKCAKAIILEHYTWEKNAVRMSDAWVG